MSTISGPSLKTGNKRASLSERGCDLYETPPQAVHALLKVEALPQKIWEPACGPGAIVAVLRDSGRTVVATDLFDWGCPNSLAGVDFLRQSNLPDGAQAVVTNPPYALAADFVRQGLKLCPKVVMLMRLAFLESAGRSDILDGGKLARVYVFSNRLPMMHRAGWTGPKASSAMAFAWFIFSSTHDGPITLTRIRWEAETSQR